MTELVRATRGVWRPQSELDDYEALVSAIVSACGDAIVCGVTAARLHRMWLPPWLVKPALPVDLIVHRTEPILEARSRSVRPEVRSRRQTLAAEEITMIDGLAVTSEARTWFDLAGVLPMADLVAAGDSALRGAATVDEVDEIVARAAHRRGVVKARAALPLLDARSRPESHLRYAIVSRGLPKPEVNVPIYTETREWISEPDLSYDDVKLALEYNGVDHAEARRMRNDITRTTDVELRGGWRQITFGPVQVFDRPDQVALYVRAQRTERRLLQRVTGNLWN